MIVRKRVPVVYCYYTLFFGRAAAPAGRVALTDLLKLCQLHDNAKPIQVAARLEKIKLSWVMGDSSEPPRPSADLLVNSIIGSEALEAATSVPPIRSALPIRGGTLAACPQRLSADHCDGMPRGEHEKSVACQGRVNRTLVVTDSKFHFEKIPSVNNGWAFRHIK
ncbi:hypothetical protein GGX14DRAFT_393951 [Mycena pura]|uniref:Uncharacterized protein n=1 Tax=Mycena pura TaxID=153505 RepID=A0AAD6VN39_9AGAR|nr:hypothetical protein GGX14DRAFT_393951 [Mycena pura]